MFCCINALAFGHAHVSHALVACFDWFIGETRVAWLIVLRHRTVHIDKRRPLLAYIIFLYFSFIMDLIILICDLLCLFLLNFFRQIQCGNPRFSYCPFIWWLQILFHFLSYIWKITVSIAFDWRLLGRWRLLFHCEAWLLSAWLLLRARDFELEFAILWTCDGVGYSNLPAFLFGCWVEYFYGWLRSHVSRSFLWRTQHLGLELGEFGTIELESVCRLVKQLPRWWLCIVYYLLRALKVLIWSGWTFELLRIICLYFSGCFEALGDAAVHA